MRTKKAIFSVLTIIFGSLGLMNIVSTDITLPIMFVFMGLTFLTNARECYDNGAKKDAMIFAVSTDITLPIMFVFMGLTFLTNARECYDNGAKKDAMIFAGVAIFVYVVTVYNLISRFM